MRISFALQVTSDLRLDFDPLSWDSAGEMVEQLNSPDGHELLDDGRVIDRGWQLSTLTAWPDDNDDRTAWTYAFAIDVCAGEHERHALLQTSDAGPDMSALRFPSQHDAVQALVHASLHAA